MFKASYATLADLECLSDDRGYDTVQDMAEATNASIILKTVDTSLDTLKEMLISEHEEGFEDGEFDRADVEWTIIRRSDEKYYVPLITMVARYAPDDTIIGVIVITEATVLP